MSYDHFLSIGKEARVIWGNPKARVASKIAFGINRYLTEAVIAYTVYGEPSVQQTAVISSG